jgi:DHA2 family multidrug resistance protein
MSEADIAAPAPWRPRANPWLIAFTVTSAAFLEILDTTIITVALPHIAGSLSVSPDDATWCLTSYLIANGIVLPISGWISSVLGRKRYFLICVAMFTLCSFLCGLATSLWQLILFRILQGLFGGGLQPSQQSIMLDTFDKSKRALAFSLTAVATIIAPVLGPTLGGLITDNASWRWAFFVNIPIGIVAFLASLALLDDPPWAKAKAGALAQIDTIGLALIALGLGCMQIVLDRGQDADWFDSNTIRLFALLGAVGIVGAVAWLLVARHPVVNLRVLKDRNFSVCCLLIGLMTITVYSGTVLIPQLAQSQLGYTATLAGMLLSPGAIVVLPMIPIVARLMPRVETRLLIGFGFFVTGVALFRASTLDGLADFGTMMTIRIGQTLGLAFLWVPISTMAYSTLRPELNRDATSLFTMFRNVAASLGVSLSTALVAQHSQSRMANLSSHLTPLDPAYVQNLSQQAAALMARGIDAADAVRIATGHVYQTLQSQAAILAYLDVFQICGLIGMAAAPVTFLLRRGKVGMRRGADH